MKKCLKVYGLAAVLILIMSGAGYGAHPLITDDTGTQGTTKYQMEFNVETSWDTETADGTEVKETGGEVAAVFTAGVSESVDIVLGLPYAWAKVKEGGMTSYDENGISDASFEVKWRAYDKDGLSLAIKPGITIPAGDENAGLGTGKIGYGAVLIVTTEKGPFTVHLNAGYLRSDYELQADEDALREDIFSASLAAEYEVVETLKVVGNVGIETNSDATSDDHPAFALAGVIYAATESLDLDFGLKAGLNEPEADITALAGVTVKF